MRGTASAPRGESTWAFDPDEPAEPLPRAGDRELRGGAASPLLGD